MTKGLRVLAMLGGIALIALGTTAKAASVADFYKGKTLTLYVGFAAGGGYDTYSRLLARYMGSQIPGKPGMIVKNKAGAATLVLANWLYTVAPKDGTVIGMIARGAPTHALLGGKGANFDPTKFHWLGSMNNEVSVCVTSARAPAKSFSELRQKTTVVGTQGPTSDSEVFANFIQNLLGAKLKLISGYPGTALTVLAMDRGEVDGICGWSWTSVKLMRPKQLKAGKLNILLQMALVSHPELPNVPLITDFATTKSQRDQMELIFSRQTMGRPFLVPPGVPKARVAALRKAFMAALRDPKFIAEAKKSKREINPVSGEDVQKLIEKVLATPKETVAAARGNLVARGPIQKVKLKYFTDTGKVTRTKRGGRRVYFMLKGKEMKTSVSGSRTKVTVDG
ncbi:MAG: tripartite tricarboxylate transporter substrate-binding protein, partial [Alphaproteobacteria bacterium]